MNSRIRVVFHGTREGFERLLKVDKDELSKITGLKVISVEENEAVHVVLTRHEGYTEFRTSHTPNQCGSDPISVEEQERRIRERFPGCTIEII